MYRSPSPLPAEARSQIVETLNARLIDGLDLHSQIKVAHWNIKGPHFAALHPLFETFAVSLAEFNDAIAERAVTLGGQIRATARHVASTSTIPDYDQSATRDLDHARLLADRFQKYLEGLHASRSIVDRLGDVDTSDLLTGIIGTFEKHTWFLRSTVET
ncbi:DNA starvation/stationary phase protection protein Dps [Chondromyces crocatus]|uniref:Ferritin n=1 Tax=Chondromyces crocatus TaxID=52 RepID=A0A0K1ENZ1_CHOCO|nr:DNA starvation/stationary phase protection protein Dps [Chondromyces crocatus]AKT42343.1 ferritin [Chondromyces crocatus]